MSIAEIHAEARGDKEAKALRLSMRVDLDDIPSLGSEILLSSGFPDPGVVEKVIHNPFLSKESEVEVYIIVAIRGCTAKTLRNALIPKGWVPRKDKGEPDTIEVRNYELKKAALAIEDLGKKDAFFKNLGDPAVRIITLGKRRANKVVIVARPIRRKLEQTDISISSVEDMSAFVEKLISLDPDISGSLVTFMSSYSGDIKCEFHGFQWTIRPYIGRH